MPNRFVDSQMKCCDRCGRRRAIHHKPTTNVCRDCKDADPEYVRLIQGAA